MFEPSEGARPTRAAVLVFVVLLLLHLILGDHIDLFGSSPDFLLVLTACVALSCGAVPGCAAGFVCGLLADLTGSGPVGLAALLMCIVGYVLGRDRAARPLATGGWRRTLPAFAVASIAYRVAYLVASCILGSVAGLGWTVPVRLVLSCALDIAVAAVAFALLARFSPGTGVGPRIP